MGIPVYAWAIFAAIGGIGGAVLLWKRFIAGQKAEIENLGLKQQTGAQAEAMAHEDELRDIRDKQLEKTGKPTIQEWKFILVLALSMCLFGCGDTRVRGYGRSWMPEIQAPMPLEYTPDEEAALNDFGTKNPNLARKIVNQSQAMRGQIDAYNAFRWENNRKCLESIGVEEAEALKLLGPRPNSIEPD